MQSSSFCVSVESSRVPNSRCFHVKYAVQFGLNRSATVIFGEQQLYDKKPKPDHWSNAANSDLTCLARSSANNQRRARVLGALCVVLERKNPSFRATTGVAEDSAVELKTNKRELGAKFSFRLVCQADLPDLLFV